MKAMPSRDKLAEFIQRCRSYIQGDEIGESQIFLDRLFQTVSRSGCLGVKRSFGRPRYRAQEIPGG